MFLNTPPSTRTHKKRVSRHTCNRPEGSHVSQGVSPLPFCDDSMLVSRVITRARHRTGDMVRSYHERLSFAYNCLYMRCEGTSRARSPPDQYIYRCSPSAEPRAAVRFSRLSMVVRAGGAVGLGNCWCASHERRCLAESRCLEIHSYAASKQSLLLSTSSRR